MRSIQKTFSWSVTSVGCAALLAALSFPPAIRAQDRDRDWQRRDHDRDRMTRIEPGTRIPVRLNQGIDTHEAWERNREIYTGSVVSDVYGENGRLAIPAGSQVNLAVRVERDNDLVLDLDSVIVDGREYAVPSRPDRIQSDKDMIGNIIGSVTGAEVRGRAVRVRAGTVLDFRINQPLEMRSPRVG